MSKVSVVTRKNAPSPVRSTTTSYFSPSSPSRRALATFCSSSTTSTRMADTIRILEYVDGVLAARDHAARTGADRPARPPRGAGGRRGRRARVRVERGRREGGARRGGRIPRGRRLAHPPAGVAGG